MGVFRASFTFSFTREPYHSLFSVGRSVPPGIGRKEKQIMENTQVKRSVPTITFREGNTTVVVGLHFKQKGKVTLDEKLRKIIREDVKASNF